MASVLIQQQRYLSATRELSGRLLVAHEEERARIARELHDDMIQRVAMLGHELEELGGILPSGERRLSNRVDGFRAELHELAEEIRRLAHRMHPSVLDHLGLPAALAGLAAEYRPAGLEVGVEVDERAAELPPAVALGLYRMAQESLRNVVKHAGAREASLRVRCDGDGVTLEVEDPGRGFDTGSTRARSGLGLTSLTERVRLLHGRVAVTSRVGEGTRVAAWVPINGRGS